MNISFRLGAALTACWAFWTTLVPRVVKSAFKIEGRESGGGGGVEQQKKKMKKTNAKPSKSKSKSD